ncbi:uncharacterized protein TNCV_2135391 [Trichonephila clavipes]|nr:uncharacterized protein TNCV_2135391 [Trichonephila clavipes]
MVQYETFTSSCKELGKVPSSLNSGSVSGDMANTPRSRKNFCYSEQQEASSAHLARLAPHAKGQPGMTHRDAHHLRIAAIAGNRGNGEFDGLALVMKHVGMSKINGLTQHIAEKERRLALYILEDVRGHPMGQRF